jgi:hypothetical protein
MSDNASIPLNSVPNEPTLSDLLNLLRKEIFLDLNCHHLASIESFDTSKQTVTATINYTKTIFTLNEDTGLYAASQVNYPLLVDMPIVILGGGNANLTFPIQQGDQCVVLFNDRSIDNWFQSGQVGPVAASRYHSFADGLALVGLRNMSSLLQNYDSGRAVLFNGTTGVGVGTTQVKIYNQMNGKLGANFTAFFTALSSFMSACSGSATDPVLAAAATAFTTAMSLPVAPSPSGPIMNIEGILE